MGENSEKIEENWQKFQKKLPPNLRPLLKADRAFEPEYVELFPKRREGFGNKFDSYEGFYYPVRMSDTYGLLLDCSINDKVNPKPAEESIKNIKAEIDSRLEGNPPSLGQSWLVSAQLADPNSQSPEDIAKICYKALLPFSNWDDDFQGKGKLLGGTVFELWDFDSLLEEVPEESDRQTATEPFTNNHVTIVLYPNANVMEQAAEFHSDWMRLFAYRAKILWAYGQTRQLKQWLKQDYITIQDCLKAIRSDRHKSLPLNQLQDTLNKASSIVSDYTIDLGYLADQERTIAINLDNYKKRIDTIAEKPTSSEFAAFVSQPTDVGFLGNFSHIFTEKYFPQVQKDWENLSPGLQRLEFAIATIRTLVEMDRAQRDRTFQNNVTIFGWGLAAAAIVASVSAQFPYVIVPVEVLTRETPTEPQETAIAVELQPSISASWDAAIMSLGYSFGAGLLFMAIAWLWVTISERSSD